jgi:hypothetical protein
VIAEVTSPSRRVARAALDADVPEVPDDPASSSRRTHHDAVSIVTALALKPLTSAAVPSPLAFSRKVSLALAALDCRRGRVAMLRRATMRM